jgi:flagellar assembly factor FliW
MNHPDVREKGKENRMKTEIAENGQSPVGPGMKFLKIPTSRFGEIEVATDKIISMTSPFLGFPESNRFVLLPHGEKSPFLWLQSLDDPELAFVVIQPEIIRPDYQPSLPGGIRQELRLEDGDLQEILVILTIPHGKPLEMTANLLGPVIINANLRLAKQVLLDHTRHETRWPVFSPRKEADGENLLAP